MRVIGEDGSQLGVLSRQEALQAARDAGLDLVEISPNAKPPVAKIIDWGKYNYQKTKQQQKNKRSAKAGELKQMRFGLKISDHDMSVKLRKVTSFIEDGNKVRLSVVFRGREMAHKEIGFQLMDKILDKMSEIAVVDQKPQFAGRQISTVIRSSNAKVKKS